MLKIASTPDEAYEICNHFAPKCQATTHTPIQFSTNNGPFINRSAFRL